MTSPTETSETTVRRSITVDAPIARAFEVFTARFDTWWPRSHHIGGADMAEAIIDPRAGGRWYERGIDGSECDWGTVLDYDPPSHVALSWNIDGEFKHDDNASRVDVWFTEKSTGVTRVELVHSEIDHHGSTWRQLRDGVSGEGGWQGLLEQFCVALAQ